MANDSLPNSFSIDNLGRKVRRVCAECGDVFYKYPSQIRSLDRAGTYCSRVCLTNSKRNGGDVTCSWCSTSFYRRFGEQGESVLQFCSQKCYAVHRRHYAKDTTYLKTEGIHSHVYVAEKTLGRKLRQGEIVHHIDEDKHNNAVDNLAVLPSQAVHAQIHFGKISCDQYRLTRLVAEVAK